MQKIYYCDMDGVLADFNGEENAVKRFETEKGFFAKLKPIESNLEIIQSLVERGEKVCILSASPNKRADKDKKRWLKRYAPFIKKHNIIICRNGENKADYSRKDNNKEHILFDDYTVNCNQWNRRENHKAVKVVGIINLKGVA